VDDPDVGVEAAVKSKRRIRELGESFKAIVLMRARRALHVQYHTARFARSNSNVSVGDIIPPSLYLLGVTGGIIDAIRTGKRDFRARSKGKDMPASRRKPQGVLQHKSASSVGG
jgi:hypothetical protein